jgi:hypothetical protein
VAAFWEQHVERVVSVGWGNRIILITLTYNTAQNSYPNQPIYTFNAIFNSFPTSDVEDAILTNEIAPVVNPPGPSPNVRAANNAWSFPRKFVQTQETDTQEFQVIDRGLYFYSWAGGIIEVAFDAFGVPLVPFLIDYTGDLTGGGGLHIIDGTNFDQVDGYLEQVANLIGDPSLYNTAYPYLDTIISSHVDPGATITFTARDVATATFINVSRVQQAASLNGTLSFEMSCLGTDGKEILNWFIVVQTWKNAGTFSLDTAGGGYDVGNSREATSVAEFSNPPNEEIKTGTSRLFVDVDLASMLITRAEQVDEAAP